MSHDASLLELPGLHPRHLAAAPLLLLPHPLPPRLEPLQLAAQLPATQQFSLTVGRSCFVGFGGPGAPPDTGTGSIHVLIRDSTSRQKECYKICSGPLTEQQNRLCDRTI